jgi:hypothetical protein
MLNFYGMILEDDLTGEITRDPKNWEMRYINLNVSSHNHLRISKLQLILDFLQKKT